MQSNSNSTGTLEEIGRRDHEVTSEYRLFGPPGTGKTTNLTRQIRRAVDSFGPDSVLVTSFSRAAAAELAGRDLPISARSRGHAALALLARARRAGDRRGERGGMEPGQPVRWPSRRQKKQGKLDGEEAADEDDSGLAQGRRRAASSS